MTLETTDHRREALETWASGILGELLRSEPASSDASFRRYFRLYHSGGTVIAMDAPPEREPCDRFVEVAGLLAAGGINVPRILAKDLARGFLLLSDLGRQTYLDVLEPANADALFAEAVDTLVRLQGIAVPAGLPGYDAALLWRELDLFRDWYLGQHLGRAGEPGLLDAFSTLGETLVTRILAQPRVLVHRDYMPRNLMAGTPPGVLDFQDAVLGPISYDPLCLFRDAFVSWPDEQVQGWLGLYWQKARAAGLPVPVNLHEFLCDCDVIGVQRHLKVIGIFARIRHRDGKPRYLEDVPRFLAYLRAAAGRRPELPGLGELLGALETRPGVPA